MKIVFATNNKHKLDEVRAILGELIEVLSLADIGCHDDIPETGRTLEENALSVTVAPAELEKALAVLHKTLILPQYEEV
jgi:XTP/dITP diphosphohydrolase